jgi:hypothetical protein
MSDTKIFVRERRKAKEKEKSPRFNMVAVTGSNVKIYATHLRKQELEEIAKAAKAELVFLQNSGDGSGADDDD